jgi:CBS domain-containing protein
VTDRDLALCLLERRGDHPGDPRARKVGEFMTRRPVTVQEDEGFDRAIDLMSQAHVRRLPVVDRRGRLRGIVSLDDILEDISRDLRAVVRLVRAQARPEPREEPAEEARARAG